MTLNEAKAERKARVLGAGERKAYSRTNFMQWASSANIKVHDMTLKEPVLWLVLVSN